MTINPAVSGTPQPPLTTTERGVAANNRAVSAAVQLLNSSAGGTAASHQFSIAIDPVTREAVVRILDVATNEVLEQLPSEYILKVAQQLSERIAKQFGSASEKTI